MKQIKPYQKLYYSLTFIAIILMLSGVFAINPKYEISEIEFQIHFILVVLLSLAFLIYPKYETLLFRFIIITITTVYFYTIFFLYPETWSTFVFLCFIPAFSILFFDKRLFYFSLFSNIFLITLTFSYILFLAQEKDYMHIKIDLTGNIINFLGSQLILFLIFHLTSDRIKKMQLFYEELQQTERLKTTGQLAAAVAHEIRNPLTVVKGFLQFYESNPSIDKNLKSNFSLMIEELDTAEHVITQFLAIAKPNNNDSLEIVDVHNALQSVGDLLTSYGAIYQHHIELKVQQSLTINANPIEFRQLIINLVKNAIEASNEGEPVVIIAERHKKEVEIKIIDTGFGMSEEEVRSVGTPFYSLKSKGTGLGLMICFNIVEKFNGTIQFQSQKGEGTTVTLHFPIAQEKS